MSDKITWEDVPAFIDELKNAAWGLLQREKSAQSLCATALVMSALRRQVPKGHEPEEITWHSRRYFFGAMYTAMRRALIDHARGRKPTGHPLRPTQVEDLNLANIKRAYVENPAQVEALALALEKIEEAKPDWAELIQHRFFSGLKWDEIARLMEVSEKTVRRMWQRARLALYSEILRILNED